MPQKSLKLPINQEVTSLVQAAINTFHWNLFCCLSAHFYLKVCYASARHQIMRKTQLKSLLLLVLNSNQTFSLDAKFSRTTPTFFKIWLHGLYFLEWKFQRHHQWQSATLYIDKYINQDRVGLWRYDFAWRSLHNYRDIPKRKMARSILVGGEARTQNLALCFHPSGSSVLRSSGIASAPWQSCWIVGSPWSNRHSCFWLGIEPSLSKFFHPYSTGPQLGLQHEVTRTRLWSRGPIPMTK